MCVTASAKPTGPRTQRGLRADARRNVAAILRAAELCLGRDPETSMAEIARQAGVGRVTLYSRFPSRGDLVEAVFARVLSDSRGSLDAVDTTGEPTDALRRLIASTWHIVHRFSAVLASAERELSPEAVRAHHDQHLERLSVVIASGRDSGAFRSDVPLPWLATVCMTLMHTAASEVEAGRLEEQDAEHAVVETIVSACRG